MTDFEKELIHYIFHVQDADDDNLSAEVICRKLYKYGLIDRGRGYWRPKKRPKYRWPATVHNGRADKEDWQCITIKPIDDEPQMEEWTKEKHEAFYTFLWNTINPNEMEEYIAMFESKAEPQTERSE